MFTRPFHAPHSRLCPYPKPSASPNAAPLLAQALLGRPGSAAGDGGDRRPGREQLEWLASISSDHERLLREIAVEEQEKKRQREKLEWLAAMSTEHERRLLDLQHEEAAAEAAERAMRAAAWPEGLGEEDWDPAKHPRLGGPPNAGWFASTGGSDSALPSGIDKPPMPDSLVRKLPHGPTYLAQMLPAATGASPAWPLPGAPGSVLPKLGGGLAAGAKGAATGAAGAAAGAARNAAMTGYWANVPGVQVLPQEFVYALERRVRAGKLSREDARGIFETALLGAQAQAFKPTGNTRGAVYQSMMDFLAKPKRYILPGRRLVRSTQKSRARISSPAAASFPPSRTPASEARHSARSKRTFSGGA